jgi:hypothetical protein
MEHTPGLETSPPGGDTLDVAGGVGALAPVPSSRLIAAGIAHRAVIERRTIAMLGEDGDATFITILEGKDASQFDIDVV